MLAPLFLWGMTLGFDAMSRFAGEALLGAVAVWPLAAGIVAGVSVAAIELGDWLRLPVKSAHQPPGLWLLLGDVAVLAIFAASFWIRLTGGGRIAIQLAVAGFGGALLVGLGRDLTGVRAQVPLSPRERVRVRGPA